MSDRLKTEDRVATYWFADRYGPRIHCCGGGRHIHISDGPGVPITPGEFLAITNGFVTARQMLSIKMQLEPRT